MSRHRTLIFVAATASTVLWALSCGDGTTEPPPDPPRPTTVTVSPASSRLAALGATVQLRAEVLDQYGQVMSGVAVGWSSSDAAVTAVDASGLVTAAGNGAATITATAGPASGSAAVAVLQEVSTVAITPAADTVVERDTLRLAAEATDANGHVIAGAEFSWASSDDAVAMVDPAGLVTGVGAGEVEVTATSAGVVGRAELLVEASVPTTVAVTPDTLEFTALSDAVRLMAEVRDQIGRLMEGERVAWASGDTLVAVVDPSGLVRAAGNGMATITAKAGEAVGRVAVMVSQVVSTVEVAPAADTVVERDTLRLAAEATDANGHVVAEAEFTWASSDDAVAMVDPAGLVTGVGVGEVEVTATSAGVVGRAELLVEASVPTTVAVTPDTLEFTALSDAVRLMAEVRDQIGRLMEGERVAWASGDTLVAVVDPSGLVRAAGNGMATITAKAGEAVGRVAVMVSQVVSTVEVAPAADTVVERDTLRLAAEATDANGHVVAEAEFTWASSDDAVAMVDPAGLVTGVGVGEVEVTATSAGVKGRAELLVEAPVPTTVAVTPDTLEFTALRDTVRLMAEVRDQIGRLMEGERVAWASGDTLVAVVDPSGLVRAAGNGAATITAKAGEAVGSAAVMVSQAAGSVVVSRPVDTIAPGDTLRFAAEAYDRNGHRVGAEFTWSSNDISVATVDGSGVVRGVAEGAATITATTDSAQGTAEITVTNPDRAVLVTLYEATDGPNWVNSEGWLSDAPLDEWYGVDIDGFGRVIGLNLQGRWDRERREWIPHGLQGSIPAELASLTNLRHLRLNHNALAGSIPTELGSLSSLESLGVDNNSLTGPIPTELGSLAALRFLSLGGNELTGVIPSELGGLSSLENLGVYNNSLTGSIPTELGSLAALRSLSLGGNKLSGPIPTELGNLSNLEDLSLGWNELTGPMPRSLLQLVNLTWLYFLSNDGLCAPGTAEFATWLEGMEESEGPFCNQADREALEVLFETAGGNGWTRSDGWLATPVLEEWHGVRADSHGRVEALDLTRNGLEGELTPAMGNLVRMTRLRLGGNALSGRLPFSLAELSLVELHYDHTELCAPTDEAFREWLSAIASHQGTGLDCLSVRGVLKTLYEATDGPNWVNSEGWLSDAPLDEWYGVDIDGFGRVVGLSLQGRWDRERREWIPHGLQGSIPAELASLTNLRYLQLNHNALAGSIPTELGSLSSLESLQLYGNELTGSIPTELGSLAALRYLSLGGNELTGVIPSELGSLSSLESLGVGNNSLTGPIPTELGSLAALRSLSLGGNKLSGPIPTELGSLSSLESLGVGNNSLTGPIPTELGSLAALRSLSLGGNKLSGPIPTELGNLSNLEDLSLGWNELTGPMPRSLLQLVNLTWLYFLSNDGLCAPGTAEFATWLEGMEESEGPFCNQADREALEVLFETAGGNGWTRSEGWLATQALEEWHGVTADALGRVSALDLSGNGLAGKVPNWGRGALVHLTELRIGENADLVGRLPLSLADLSLRVLHYAGTGVCAPADEAFARWLNSIPSHEGTGIECAPLSDREILEIVYGATAGPDWTNSENWLTDRPLREWHGVGVDSRGRVTGLGLTFNRIAGSIPPELGSLTHLQDLSLGGFSYRLAGGIPPELGNLANLRSLSLFQTGLKGRIPSQLGGLANLRRLSLGYNQLAGSIPLELGNLVNLSSLDLQENELTGAIPRELADLANLERLDLTGNELTGSIPAQLGDLGKLGVLSLGRNRLTGSLPTELRSLGNLKGLYVGHNDLTGAIPREFGTLTGLRGLALSGNINMSGALPSSLTNLRSLEILEASGTQLCAPSDPRFLEWLDQLPSHRVVRCGTAPAMAYLVQPVQSRDFPVPLVAGEGALLRVFVTATQQNEERLPPVRASFHLNGALAHVADIPGKPGPIPTDVDEGSLGASANGVIPGEVVQPGLEMVIEIDPDETLDPALGVVRRIPETGRLSVDVRDMPVLNLTVIPFLWTTSPDSAILDHTAGMVADPYGHELLAETRVLLPVGGLQVAAHEPVLTSSNSMFALIGETGAIRALEGGGGHWMGMMSGPITGAGGVAYKPGRVSASAPSVSTIAHELGHNMSLSHAPCGGAGGPDPAFPYGDGSSGAWGFDLDRGILVRPSRPDLMSYCGPEWVSDYHFSKALRFRLADEGDASPAMVAESAASLLLWGGVDSTGTPFIEPAFVVDAPPALPASVGEYVITGRDGGGGELFSLRFAMPEVADGDGSSSFAFVLPVQPGWQGNLATITLSGPGGDVTLDGGSDQPMTILRDPRTRRVRAILRDVPGPDLARTDVAGALGLGQGLETRFSRGIPDSAAWRR